MNLRWSPCQSTGILQSQETSKFHCSQDKMGTSAPRKGPSLLGFPEAQAVSWVYDDIDKTKNFAEMINAYDNDMAEVGVESVLEASHVIGIDLDGSSPHEHRQRVAAERDVLGVAPSRPVGVHDVWIPPRLFKHPWRQWNAAFSFQAQVNNSTNQVVQYSPPFDVS
ncbi:hypothetical protein B296_00045687 [Ensete ventricosum]|uniref:Uncharacterized protein n=1 Tax=Ensete ventricosum TaxID=4639 RepID=A0A426XH81_ENSVE|nr:hypothetical protein B296_00045687 [Ensete ventricosum]